MKEPPDSNVRVERVEVYYCFYEAKDIRYSILYSKPVFNECSSQCENFTIQPLLATITNKLCTHSTPFRAQYDCRMYGHLSLYCTSSKHIVTPLYNDMG